MVDANGDYTLDDIDVFRRLDEFNLMMIEQPLAGPMLEESAELQRQIRTPLCLDESLETVAAAERAIALGSLHIANIKIQRVGGFRNALRMFDLFRRTPIGRLDRHDAGTRDRTGTGRGAVVACRAAHFLPTWRRARAGFATTSSIRGWRSATE